MARLLALEWTDAEARCVVAGTRGGTVVFERAFSAELRRTADAGGSGVSETETGAQIAEALAAHHLGRSDVIVAVGRSSIELRQLSLPPAPDDELPDLVRFQAMREFNALGDDWPLDFVPLDTDPDAPRTVLAAAIDPQQVRRIDGICQAAGLRLRRLVLRPCAAASLLARRIDVRRRQVCLLVELLRGEADLTVMVDRNVAFLRTARLPGDPSQTPTEPKSLVAEIRRTMAAAQNQLGGRQVESIVLCGESDTHARLATAIENALGVPTELFDPLARLSVEPGGGPWPPEHADRFAPLLGMLLDELEQTGHGIDFLHPRHRPEPPSRTRQAAMIAGGVGALVLLLLLALVLRARSINNRIADLKEELEGIETQIEETEKDTDAVKDLEEWTDQDVPWLDHLKRLSEQLPPSDHLMVTSMEMDASLGGGQIRVDGLVDDNPVIKEIAEDLEKYYKVAPGTRKDDDSQVPYTKHFDGVLLLKTEARR